MNGAELAAYSQRGVVTPDHIIRTKNRPLVVPAPEAGKLDAFATRSATGVSGVHRRLRCHFAPQNARAAASRPSSTALPRVVLVPGVGLFGLGRTAKDASIAADLAENTVKVITDAEAIGRYEPLPESDLFDARILEPRAGEAERRGGEAADRPGRARDRRRRDRRCDGQGSCSGRRRCRHARHRRRGGQEGGQPPSRALGIECDVTKPDQVKRAFALVCERFGGVDIVVSNAGAAWQGRIGEVSDELLRKSFELNFFAHQTVAQEAVRIMLKQGTGGALLFNISKQAVNPGHQFRALRAAQGDDHAADAPIRRSITARTASARTGSMPTASGAGS